MHFSPRALPDFERPEIVKFPLPIRWELDEYGLASSCSQRVIGDGCGRDAIFISEFLRSAVKSGWARLPVPAASSSPSGADLQPAIIPKDPERF